MKSTRLASGAVDGQDNPLPTVVDKKFYEVTKQISLTSHLVDLNYIAFSKKTWDGLTADQQMAVQQYADDGGRLRSTQTDWTRKQSRVDFIRSQGVRDLHP